MLSGLGQLSEHASPVFVRLDHKAAARGEVEVDVLGANGFHGWGVLNTGDGVSGG